MDSRRLRVVFVLDWFFYYAAAVANALAESCDILFVTRDHGYELGIEGDAFEEKRRALDPRIELVTISCGQADLRSFRSAARARSAIRDFAPDVVHVQAHTDWRLLYAQGGARGVPIVVTIHDVVPHAGSVWSQNLVHRTAREVLFQRASGFIVHGDRLADFMRETHPVGGRLLFSIPHGVLCQPCGASPLPQGSVALFFGRIEYYKGLDTLIAAVPLVLSAIPDFRLIVAGRGPELDEAMRMAGDGSTYEWIPGFINDQDIPDLFARASVVVLPYREASQSGVVPLAFASARPVLATRVGSLAEAVEDGVTGRLCEPESPEALASALIAMLSDSAELERMAGAALLETREGRLSPHFIAERHVAAYEATIKHRVIPGD